MPRDGFEIYNIPSGTHGAPDTTIESARYNAFVDDVAQDLNHPRPILSGGTGADDKTEAMTNLGGEIAKQIITNFDSDLLFPGSFYCATTATGSPVTGHAFAGWIYVTDNNNMVIEARDASDTVSPGNLYVREKKGGVWAVWKNFYGNLAAAISSRHCHAVLSGRGTYRLDEANDTGQQGASRCLRRGWRSGWYQSILYSDGTNRSRQYNADRSHGA